MKQLFIIAVMTFSLSAYGQQKNVIKQRKMLKDFAFCACMSNELKKDSVAILNEGSESGYIELSSYDVEAFEKVRQFAFSWVDKQKFKSYNNSKLIYMKCIKFYNSPDLSKFIVGLDKYIH